MSMFEVREEFQQWLRAQPRVDAGEPVIEEKKFGLRSFIENGLERALAEKYSLTMEHASLVDQLAEVKIRLSNRNRMVDEMTAWLEANP